MNLSYWEKKSWFSNIDFTVVGSGIVGLSCALYLKKCYPTSNVLIIEKGILPQGASTKNAGFACFGSLSELIEDLKTHSEQEVLELVIKRWQGLQQLRENLGDASIDLQQNGGYELFTDEALYEDCLSKRNTINSLLKPIFEKEVFSLEVNSFHFRNIVDKYIFNIFESQLDTGKMMLALLKKVQALGVNIVNNVEVERFTASNMKVAVQTNLIAFDTKKLFIATNGFANALINEDVRPARAQILITKPIKNLHIKGTFHLDKGYYYFRNIDDRILLGGGRNLDFKTEETAVFGRTALVQHELERLLKESILPETAFEIDSRWSGIMGVGNRKKAIVKALDSNVFCGIRMGGMGIAIGSTIGRELSEMA